MRFEDLPPELRKQVRTADPGPPASRPRRRRDLGSLVCTTCAEALAAATEGRLARHQADTGHGHFAMALPVPPER